MDKKAVRWIDQWAEISAFTMMAIGFLVSILADSAIVNYVIILMVGFMVGRTYYIRKSRLRFPFFLITVFFVGGYVIGTQLMRRGDVAVILACFAVGTYLGNSIYRRGLLR